MKTILFVRMFSIVAERTSECVHLVSNAISLSGKKLCIYHQSNVLSFVAYNNPGPESAVVTKTVTQTAPVSKSVCGSLTNRKFF